MPRALPVYAVFEDGKSIGSDKKQSSDISYKKVHRTNIIAKLRLGAINQDRWFRHFPSNFIQKLIKFGKKSAVNF